MKRFLVSMAMFVLMSIVTPSARADAVYDAVGDLTRQSMDEGIDPNGAWSYGYRSTVSSNDFSLFSECTTSGYFGNPDALIWTVPPQESFFGVYKNFTGATLRSVDITFPTDELLLHPGFDGNFAIVRWTAPEDGLYQLATTFTSRYDGGDNEVYVVVNGSSVFHGTVHGPSVDPSQQSAAYAATLPLDSGTTIDFLVGETATHWLGGEVGFTTQIREVPEPSTFVLVGIGAISLLGYAWRRRKWAT